MERKTFLTIASTIALGVGLFAFISPDAFLATKGIAASESATVWLREVGILLIAAGIAAFLVRDHKDSPTLKAFFVSNIVVQLGMLAIEPVAYANGVITKLSGIVPNTAVHVLLAAGFIHYLLKMKRSA